VTRPRLPREQFADLSLIYERVLGPEHPDALTVRGNVARWTGEEGALAAARDLFAELLPVYERVMGAEHPDTLDIHTKLAHWTEQRACWISPSGRTAVVAEGLFSDLRFRDA
jgi:hypothetical protein